jgi:hypothetical protein
LQLTGLFDVFIRFKGVREVVLELACINAIARSTAFLVGV